MRSLHGPSIAGLFGFCLSVSKLPFELAMAPSRPCESTWNSRWLSQAVLVHELSHAYHAISYQDGVTNKKIKEAYEKGVSAGYYDTRPHIAQQRDDEIG